MTGTRGFWCPARGRSVRRRSALAERCVAVSEQNFTKLRRSRPTTQHFRPGPVTGRFHDASASARPCYERGAVGRSARHKGKWAEPLRMGSAGFAPARRGSWYDSLCHLARAFVARPPLRRSTTRRAGSPQRAAPSVVEARSKTGPRPASEARARFFSSPRRGARASTVAEPGEEAGLRVEVVQAERDRRRRCRPC